jgi:hypothetical protein
MSAMHSSISGINNTAVGAYALSESLLSGINNTAIGGGALDYTVGSDNSGMGYHAGFNITTGSNNIAIGSNSNIQNPTASDQLSIGNVVYGTGFNSTATGKIGIGIPNPLARLQIVSSNQVTPSNTDGIMIPKINAFPLTNPLATQDGLLVYLTTPIGANAAGFYYWQTAAFPSSWVPVGSKSGWGLTGNAGTTAGTNFIGTTDNADVVFKRGGMRIGQLSSNIAFGFNALNVSSTGNNIVAIGDAALQANTTGSDNTAVGDAAMIGNLGGNRNTAIGSNTMEFNTAGNDNTALGNAALFTNTGNLNTATGKSSLFKNDLGNSNTANGSNALYLNTGGSNNTAVGDSSLYWNTTGSNNVGIGYHAGYLSVGSNNIAVGTNSNVSNPNLSDQLSIGNVIYGSTMATTALGKIGIGETDPNAKLQITSSNQATPANTDGIIIPKVDAFPLTNPTAAQNGMMVFLTATAGSNPSGFYYWDNTASAWLAVGAKNNWGLNGNTGTNAAINYIGSSDSKDVAFRSNNIEVLRLTTTGKVGIGAPIPGAELEVNGFTKSGSTAPAVKMIKLTGTTGSSQGATTNIAHGITNSTKILGVTVLVEYAAFNSIGSSYNGSAGYEFDYYITNTNIAVWLKSGNSANILTKPIRILVTYEQ